MSNLFFVNPFFEEEILSSEKSLLGYLFRHPVYLQLHYLSCLLTKEDEFAVLFFSPEEGYFERLSQLGITASSLSFKGRKQRNATLSSWGPSLLLSSWAKEKEYSYKIPCWDLIKKVNGKDFSFALGTALPGAEVITTEKDFKKWFRSLKGPKVVKSLYGSSGRGHLLLGEDHEESGLQLFKREGVSSFLAEPWVERVLDFSSQWDITKQGEITYLGATICENTPRGIYRKSLVGPEEVLFARHQEFLKEHLTFSKRALEKMKSLGFFGPVGIDAMIYKHPQSGKIQLQPIVEINGRRTMGWVALRLFEKLKLNDMVSFSYELKKTKELNLLPSYVFGDKGKKISLPGQLVMREERLF